MSGAIGRACGTPEEFTPPSTEGLATRPVCGLGIVSGSRGVNYSLVIAHGVEL